MTIATALEARSIGSPDDVRSFTDGKGKAEIVRLAGHDVSRSICEPGWRWSENVKPLAETESCQAEHFGYCIQGSMQVEMDDGTSIMVKPGDFVAIPPGHDAWVEGEETCVLIDFGDLSKFAQA